MMAEENRGARSDGRTEGRTEGRSDGRNGRRRRYYKRKGDDRKPNAGEPGQAQPAQSVQPANQKNAQTQGGQSRPAAGESARGTGQSQSQTSQNRTVSAQHGGGPAPLAADGSRRGMRKRRRSRARRGEGRVDAPILIEKDQEYVAPKSVFVYTHVARPSSRDNYEFRSEHFSRVGHTLEDYTVDLTLIFDTPRPNFGAGVAGAFADMEARGEVATEARFQPWVEYMEGGRPAAPEPSAAVGVEPAGTAALSEVTPSPTAAANSVESLSAPSSDAPDSVWEDVQRPDEPDPSDASGDLPEDAALDNDL